MKRRILICDDESAIRLLLTEALRDDYEAVEVADGRDVLMLVTKEPFDLVIIDIKMPSIHGLEIIQRIRERGIKIPVIICSAYRMMEDDVIVQTSDVAAFITKPIDIKAMKAKIFELIGS